MVTVASRGCSREIFAEEPAKLADFYRELFGWTITKAQGVDYFHVQTAPPEVPAIRGGITYRAIPEPRSWVHYVWVTSLDDAVERVKAARRHPPAAEDAGSEDGLVRGGRGSRAKYLRRLSARSERDAGPRTGLRHYKEQNLASARSSSECDAPCARVCSGVLRGTIPTATAMLDAD